VGLREPPYHHRSGIVGICQLTLPWRRYIVAHFVKNSKLVIFSNVDLISVVALNYLRFNKPKEAKIYLKKFFENNSLEFDFDKEYLDIAKREIEKAEKLGVKIIPFFEEAFPSSLLNIPDKSLLLYVKGDFKGFTEEAIAVVGSRKCTEYGKSISYKIAYDLGSASVTVVSGLAYGIDSAAHNGAIDANGRTVAVLGSGIDIIYPKDHLNLAKKIENHGFLVSEFPFGTAPVKYNFPFRNRIISALSLGVVVVEAELKSGSLITAGHALDQGKQVFAVPGNITSPSSAGTNALIRDGAIPLLSTSDIFENISTLKHLALKKEEEQLTKEESEILNVLSDGDTFDTLKEKVKLNEGELLISLTTLEVKRLIKKNAGRYFKI